MSTSRELFDKAFLGCISRLESLEDAPEITFSTEPGVSTADIAIWESKSSPIKLPLDMKMFYSKFNGVLISWKLLLGEKSITVGRLCINSLAQLVRKPIDGTVKFNNTPALRGFNYPDQSSFYFTIDSIPQIGDVVLVFLPDSEKYLNCIPVNLDGSHIRSDAFSRNQIWFIGANGEWSYICESFNDYLRLMVVHLGILGWQYTFTPSGLPLSTLEWMNLFCKERLCVNLCNVEEACGTAS